MKLADIKHIYSAEATKITIIWTVAGFFMFLLESLFRLSFNVKEGWLVSGLAYVLPPLVFGYPFALIQTYLEVKRPFFNMTAMFLLKTLLYLVGILAVYYLVRIIICKLDAAIFIGRFFEMKFMVIWGTFLVIFLKVRHMFSHFEKKILSAWLSGEFYRPTQEERIFLFIDINNATSIAEKIGSKAYFYYLNDFRGIIESAIFKYKGEIFQYVGDEVVISWKTADGINNNNAIELFFEIQKLIKSKEKYFQGKYDFNISVKGALHIGEVTKGELGKNKRDFAFVGDVLNTTSRMYSICKREKVSLVISKELMFRFGSLDAYHPLSKGDFKLRGKDESIQVFALSAPSNMPTKV